MNRRVKVTWNIQMPLTFVGYREDDLWVARVLEMDLIGHGRTPGEAVKRAQSVVESHIVDAFIRRRPSLLFRDAEPRYWRMARSPKPRKIVVEKIPMPRPREAVVRALQKA